MQYTQDQLDQALEAAVLGLFSDKCSNFLMSIYCAHTVNWKNCGTAYTTGKELALDPVWFMGLTPRSRVALLAHEMWHPAYLHTDPSMWIGKDHRILNQAMDHVINLMLLEHGYHFDMPGCYDPRFKGMTTDQVYAILFAEHQQKAAGNPPPPCNGGQGGSAGDPSAGGGGPPTADLPFGNDVVPSANDKDAKEVLAAVIRGITLAKLSGQAGNMPGELITKIEKLLRPKLPWHVLVRRWFNEKSRQGYTWRRPNRRHEDVYLPSIQGEEGLDHLMFAMDSSGSMLDPQLQSLNTEVHDVKARFNPKRMTLVNFDTAIRNVWEIDEETDFTTLDFKGRGGTSLNEVWEMVKKLKPSALVVLSDLDCTIPPRPGNIPVLWICFDRPNRTVPYGTLIHLDTRSTNTP